MFDKLRADYAGAGFSGQLPFGDRPALLIVDAVKAYIDPAASLYLGADAALASIARIAAAARLKSLPVIFTKVAYDAGGTDGGLFYKKVPALKSFAGGGELAGFTPELSPHPGDVVVQKQYASAFFGTSLASTLHVLQVDTLLITGFSTSGCVRASTVDAIQQGYAPFVVRDACADRDAGPHEANLFDLQAKYAEVVSEAQALELIESR